MLAVSQLWLEIIPAIHEVTSVCEAHVEVRPQDDVGGRRDQVIMVFPLETEPTPVVALELVKRKLCGDIPRRALLRVVEGSHALDGFSYRIWKSYT